MDPWVTGFGTGSPVLIGLIYKKLLQIKKIGKIKKPEANFFVEKNGGWINKYPVLINGIKKEIKNNGL